jgi:hypothetical protein
MSMKKEDFVAWARSKGFTPFGDDALILRHGKIRYAIRLLKRGFRLDGRHDGNPSGETRLGGAAWSSPAFVMDPELGVPRGVGLVSRWSRHMLPDGDRERLPPWLKRPDETKTENDENPS